MTNRQWFQLHSWAGFAFAGLLLLICASGVLASLSYEIQYLSDEKYRALEPRQGPVAWAEIEKNLAVEYPESHILGGLVHEQSYLAGEMRLMTPIGFRFVYFDPATGQLLGEGHWGQISRFLRDIHMYLSMGKIGKYIVTLTSLMLILSLVSSFYVYRKWWREFFSKPAGLRWKKRPDWSSWHKLLGLWTWWFVFLMAITGLWYLVEQTMFSWNVEHYPKTPTITHTQAQQTQRALPVSELISRTQVARPDLDIRGFFYPHQYHQVMGIVGQDNSLLVRDRANRVYLDPISGDLVKLQFAHNLDVIARLSDTADPLHFGNFAGLWLKVLYAAFGLGLTFLVAGGMRMHYLRTQRKCPSTAKWLGVTGSASLILAIFALIYTSLTFAGYSNTSTSLSPQLKLIAKE